MAMHYMNTKDLGTKKVNMVIYGKSGLGKTPWAASGHDNPLLIDLEGGITSLEGEDVPLLQARTWAQLESIIMHLENLFKGKQVPDTIIVDSLTEAADILHRERDGTNALQLFPFIKNSVIKIFNRFKSLPCHTIFICKEEVESRTLNNGEKDISLRRPRLAGSKLTHELPYLTDCLLFINNDFTNVSIAHAKSGTDFEAKDRYGMLPDSFKLLDMTAKQVIDLLAGNPPPTPPKPKGEEEKKEVINS